jgi:NADH dehydrogenase FAD-containing subunit
MQQGRYVGKLIGRHIAGKNGLKPFRYFDKGNMAVVGKGYAVLQSGKLKMHGLLAWFGWAAIHILYLAQASLRITVFLQWLWTFFTGDRGSRLIVESQTFKEPAQSNAPSSTISPDQTKPKLQARH